MFILKDLNQALKAGGLQPDLITSGSEQLGSDLAMPCFALAKETQQSPQQLAESLAAKIRHPAIAKTQAVKGYVNLWLRSDFLVRQLLEAGRERPLGWQAPHGRRVIVEYFSPNLSKPLSVGHLRNLWQGRALTNLYKAAGYEVITDNHLGDWGKIFGLWVMAYLRYAPTRDLTSFNLTELGELYKKIVQDLKTEKAQGKTTLETQVQAWLLKLQQGDQQAWQYHQAFKDISLQEIEAVLADLGISFDEMLGEAFYHEGQYSLRLLQKLQQRGLIQIQADGSWLADLSSQAIKTPLLVLKSNGATLYATADVATIHYRQERWQPAKIIYVVGTEQQFYFKQLFAFNALSQLTKAELIHHAYGLVEEIGADGRRQKMSSRQGAVGLREVLSKAHQLARAYNQKGLSEADLKIIAHGALIFQEFSQGRQHNVLFDWDKLFSLSDMSGAYVQYATLRLQSIFAKAKVTDYQPSLEYDWQAEHKLMLKILSFQDRLQEAIKYSDLHKLATHIFELCQALNRYYENTLVLDDQPDIQASRLWLMKIIHQHLCDSLALLGVKIPSRM